MRLFWENGIVMRESGCSKGKGLFWGNGVVLRKTDCFKEIGCYEEKGAGMFQGKRVWIPTIEIFALRPFKSKGIIGKDWKHDSNTSGTKGERSKINFNLK